ncbi:hypothetical protein F5Y04DRAFT_288868 [Hypomontagnella monticulosa]|nr:hypothetical protein F5Y04DRAFT_288868 [Hypomontagnella monticulosa]
MREALKATGFDFVPYFEDDFWDPMRDNNHGYRDIWSFPPTANLPYTLDTVSMSIHDIGTALDFPMSEEEKELLKEFHHITDALKDEESLTSWMRKHRSLGIKFDTSRLARYALYHDKLQIVKYLVYEEQADLKQEDTLGRSAIFYAMWGPKSFQTWKYISRGESGVQKLLDRVDTRDRRTALHYAVEHRSLEGIEFLLANHASTEIEDKNNKKPIDLITDDHPYDEENWHMRMIFEFYRLYPAWSTYEIRIISLAKWQRSSIHPLNTVYEDLTPHTGNIWEEYVQNATGGFLWLHVPCTNGIIIHALLRRYERDTERSTHVSYTPLPSFQESPPPLCYIDTINNEPFYSSNFRKHLGDDEPKKRQSSIVFPCLVLRAKKRQQETRKEAQELQETISHAGVKETIQLERTIDETYFPSLLGKTLDDRNEQQVVSRETVKTLVDEQAGNDKIPMLMVPQLWLWRFDRFVLTAYSAAEPGQLISKDHKRLLNCRSEEPEFLVGLIIADQISKFGELQDNGTFPPPLDIFEMGILRVLSDVQAYTIPSNELRVEMMKESNFIFDIADIREELAMVRFILHQQLDILQSLIGDIKDFCSDLLPYSGSKDESEEWETRKRKREWETITDSEIKIKSYLKRVEKLDKDAGRIERRVQDQLNLKRTHVTIKDTRAGLILSTSSLALSIAVGALTVITIIFAPLSFVTSLFALPIDVLLQNQFELDGTSSPDTSAYRSSYIATWFAVAEMATLAVTGIILAFSVMRFRGTKTYAALKEDQPEQKGGKLERQAEQQKTVTSSVHQDEMTRRRGFPLWNRKPAQEHHVV